MERRTAAYRPAATAAASAAAQGTRAGYPEQPIKWVVPYPAGGGTDMLARTLAEAMRQRSGQPIVIDNRPGASTNIGADAGGQVQARRLHDHVGRQRGAGLQRAPVQQAAVQPGEGLHATSARSASSRSRWWCIRTFPAQDFKAFLAYVKANPGKVNYASPGNGSPHHLAMEMFKNRTGTSSRTSRTSGAAPAMADVMGGQVPCMFLDLASGLSIIQSNKVRVLAIGTGERSKLLPDVPTLAELGVPNTDVFAFQGILGPGRLAAGGGHAAEQRVEQALQQSDGRQEAFTDFGMEAMPRHRRSSSRRCRVRSRSAGGRSSRPRVKLDEPVPRHR